MLRIGNVPRNKRVRSGWSPYVVDPSPGEELFGVRQKQCALLSMGMQRHVDQFTSRRHPNRMELSLDKNAGPLPYQPAVKGFAAMLSDLVGDGLKAFRVDCSRPSADRNEHRLVPGIELSTKRPHVLVDSGGCCGVGHPITPASIKSDGPAIHRKAA